MIDDLIVKSLARCVVYVTFSCIAVSGCGPDANATSPVFRSNTVSASRLSMGSTLTLTAWTRQNNDEAAAKAAFDEVFEEFARLETLMSTWIPESDVSRINRAAGIAAVPASAEVRDVLATARQVSEWTGGKFDVTFAALSGLWKFDHDQDNLIPDMDVVRGRLPLIDYRAIHVNDAAGTVFLARTAISIHLGGIGKGYAIDRAAGILRRRGVRDFMVQSGGDIYVSGLKDGNPGGWAFKILEGQRTAASPSSICRTVRSARRATTSGRFSRTAGAITTSSIPPPESPLAGRAASPLSPTVPCLPTRSRPACFSSARMPAWRSSSACLTSTE